METINFYRAQGPYGCFSNFAACPIEINGKIWPTSEHFFQAQKFAGTAHEEAIRACATPNRAARLGRMRSKPLRGDWASVKDDVMRQAVLAKFRQHADIRATLLGTGDALLAEHTRNDRYWGDGGDGAGKNMLGMILMEVRQQLRAEFPGGSGRTCPEPTVPGTTESRSIG